MRLIDADQLLQKLQKDPLFPFVEEYGITRVIEAAPTIEAEPIRHGRWIHREYREYNSRTSIALISIDFYKCSVCGYSSRVDTDNYCPTCGAKMETEEQT